MADLFWSTSVDLAPFWTAYEELVAETEPASIQGYRDAAAYWQALDAKLAASSASLGKVRTEMATNSGWAPDGDPATAGTAFFGRMDEGTKSIAALQAPVAGARKAFDDLAEILPTYRQSLDRNHQELLQLERANLLGRQKITANDRGAVDFADQQTRDRAQQIVDGTTLLRDTVRDQLLNPAQQAVTAVPAEAWRGPTTYTGQWPGVGAPTANTPGGPTGPGGPGGPAPGGPGGPAPGGPGGPAPGGPGGPAPGGPGGTPGSTPESGSPTSTSDTGTDQPGADTPSGPDLGDSPTSDTGLDTSLPELPPPDPSLAGTPTPSTLPPLSTPSLGDPSLGNIPSGLNSSIGGPTSSSPLSSSLSLPPIGSSLPSGRNSTVDSSRPPAAGASAAEPGPSLARGPAGAQSGTSTGSGMYPPMMPPMMPPGGGGAGAGGVRPGEAEFSGGMGRKVGRRESWRAGLRSQLLGRTAEHDDEEEPYAAPLSPPSGGAVLDEELWQVPGAAPVTPPESPPRRGRSWGP